MYVRYRVLDKAKSKIKYNKLIQLGETLPLDIPWNLSPQSRAVTANRNEVENITNTTNEVPKKKKRYTKP